MDSHCCLPLDAYPHLQVAAAAVLSHQVLYPPQHMLPKLLCYPKFTTSLTAQKNPRPQLARKSEVVPLVSTWGRYGRSNSIASHMKPLLDLVILDHHDIQTYYPLRSSQEKGVPDDKKAHPGMTQQHIDSTYLALTPALQNLYHYTHEELYQALILLMTRPPTLFQAHLVPSSSRFRFDFLLHLFCLFPTKHFMNGWY